jgi:surface antigen
MKYAKKGDSLMAQGVRTLKRIAVGVVLGLAFASCADAPTSPDGATPPATSPAFAVGNYPPNAPSTALCGYSSDNPYPCCQNSYPNAGSYGNCTGGAWQLAKENGWGRAVPGARGSSWGDASSWANEARRRGYIVESTPSINAIAVGATHVATVQSWTSKRVTTRDQACGFGKPHRFYPAERDTKWFSQGFIRAPIPEVVLLLWSGASSMTGKGTLTVKRKKGSVTVNFGYSKLRSNVATGPSAYGWKVSGNLTSTEGSFAKTFTSAGTYPISSTVTNRLGVSTVATATLVVK